MNTQLPADIALEKCPTGIDGLDQITSGGIPRGRATLVSGYAGCGKTLLGMEFLVRGITQFNEAGVFVSFEENALELTQNVASFGWDLVKLERQEKLRLEYVYVERSEIEETGEYDLEGLFIRLALAMDAVGARRVVLDTVEALFSGLTDTGILRAELRRLFRWLKERGATVIITGERGKGSMTRYGFEEYVSDCVIDLDHRVEGMIATRRLRVVKYRGSSHGTNEYPFLIGNTGLSVIPITSLALEHEVSSERISSGVPRLDTMLEGKGYYRGSSILVSGTAGTGKSSLVASFVNAACARGERCLYFAFEESKNQIVRNMHSIGMHLEHWIEEGSLKIIASRPSLYGLEMHLAVIYQLIRDEKPMHVVLDPISNLVNNATSLEVQSMLTRVIDYCKTKMITTLFTNLTSAGTSLEMTSVNVSSLMDTWILLRDIEFGGERNRGIFILKSRGMSHSNQIREFLITREGIDLVDVYLGPEGVLTGSARYSQMARDREQIMEHQGEIRRKHAELERKRKIMESQISVIQAEFQAEEEELKTLINREKKHLENIQEERGEMARLRKADSPQ